MTLLSRSLIIDNVAFFCIWLRGFDGPSEAVPGSSEKGDRVQCSTCISQTVHVRRCGGSSVVEFFLNLPPVSHTKPLNSRDPVGRTHVDLWKHVWAGSVGFLVSRAWVRGLTEAKGKILHLFN